MSCCPCFDGVQQSRVKNPARIRHAARAMNEVQKSASDLAEHRRKMLTCLRELEHALHKHGQMDQEMKVAGAALLVIAVPINFFCPPLGAIYDYEIAALGLTRAVHEWATEKLGASTLDEYMHQDWQKVNKYQADEIKAAIAVGAALRGEHSHDVWGCQKSIFTDGGGLLWSSYSAYSAAVEAMHVNELARAARNVPDGAVKITLGFGEGMKKCPLLGNIVNSKNVKIEAAVDAEEAGIFCSKCRLAFGGACAIYGVFDAYNSWGRDGPTDIKCKEAIKEWSKSIAELEKVAGKR